MLISRLPQSGFTLLELLLALSLAALVMLILAVGAHTALKEWERSSSRLDDSLDMELTLLQIERALEGAFPHLYKDRDENRQFIFFEGEEKQLSWVSTVSPGRQPGLTAWQLAPSEGKKEGISLRMTPAFANNPMKNIEKSKSFMTFEGYKAYFEYLYVDEKIKEDSKWIDEWSAKKLLGLPSAVRIRLEKGGDDSKHALEIIAVIKAHEHEKFRPIKP